MKQIAALILACFLQSCFRSSVEVFQFEQNNDKLIGVYHDCSIGITLESFLGVPGAGRDSRELTIRIGIGLRDTVPTQVEISNIDIQMRSILDSSKFIRYSEIRSGKIIKKIKWGGVQFVESRTFGAFSLLPDSCRVSVFENSESRVVGLYFDAIFRYKIPEHIDTLLLVVRINGLTSTCPIDLDRSLVLNRQIRYYESVNHF